MNILRPRQTRRFTIGDDALMVRVRESQRASTARIIVGPRRPLEVIVPRGTTGAEVDDLLERKRRWVERKVIASRRIAEQVPQLGLDQPGVVWLGGVAVPVDRRRGRSIGATLRNGRLIVPDSDDPSAAIARWYRRETRRSVSEVVRRESIRLGVQCASIAIRDPRTRWGSCSRIGNLSFSWRLLVAPSQVLGYVVVHELCHLREPSHQKPFWRLLDAARPGWQTQARWLRDHGLELRDYDLAVAVL